MDETSSPRYSLSPHVFFCPVREGVIFLDLKQDKYFSLAETDLRPISRFISDFSSLRWSSSDLCQPGRADMDLLETLVRRGMLTRGPPSGERPPIPHVQQTGLLTDLCESAGYRVSLRCHHLMNFTMAFVTTLWALRRHSLEFAVQRIARRRSSMGDAPFDLEKAAEATAAFRRIRPYFFTAHDRCLLHALVLTDYLARYKLFPTFVIGVKVAPWAAHAWVQHESHVLDMAPEKTFSFTPVFAI